MFVKSGYALCFAQSYFVLPSNLVREIVRVFRVLWHQCYNQKIGGNRDRKWEPRRTMVCSPYYMTNVFTFHSGNFIC